MPAGLKDERRAALMELQQPIARAKSRAKKGKVFDAILEGPCVESDLLLEGRLASQAPEIDGRLLINDLPDGETPRVGQIVRVKVTGAHEYDLVGRVLPAAS